MRRATAVLLALITALLGGPSPVQAAALVRSSAGRASAPLALVAPGPAFLGSETFLGAPSLELFAASAYPTPALSTLSTLPTAAEPAAALSAAGPAVLSAPAALFVAGQAALEPRNAEVRFADRGAPARAQAPAREDEPFAAVPSAQALKNILSGVSAEGRWTQVMDGARLSAEDASPPVSPEPGVPTGPRLSNAAAGTGALPRVPDVSKSREAVFSGRSQNSLSWLLRAVVRPIMNLFYDLHAYGLDNIPKTGGVLLVGNHPSYLDPLLVGLFSPRPVRFLMYKPYYDNPRLHWLLKRLPIIPIATIEDGNGPKSILKSLALAREALERGEVVAIFPEGATSRNGNMHSFKRGMEFLVRKLNAAVVPFHVDGTWGSLLSWKPRAPWREILRRGRRLLQIRFGPALEKGDAQSAREAVERLSVSDMEARVRLRGRTLALDFLRVAKRRWSKPAAADASGASVTYGRLLTAAVLLAGALGAAPGERIGVLLPASVEGVTAQVALQAAGYQRKLAKVVFASCKQRE